MTRYLIALGTLVLLVGVYFLLAPDPMPPAPDAADPEPVAEPAPDTVAPRPEPPAPEVSIPLVVDEDTRLETLAAELRERLPETVTDGLTLTDAVFLPRMRIMELRYSVAAEDARGATGDMRAQIEARAETICRAAREMFDMGVTLRNSFEDGRGTLLRRHYLLPEDCQQFF